MNGIANYARLLTVHSAGHFRHANGLQQLFGYIKSVWSKILNIPLDTGARVGGAAMDKPLVPRIAREELIRSETARLSGNVRKSVWHLRRAIEIYPEYPDALTRLGIYWRDRGQDDLASHYFRRAIEVARHRD